MHILHRRPVWPHAWRATSAQIRNKIIHHWVHFLSFCWISRMLGCIWPHTVQVKHLSQSLLMCPTQRQPKQIPFSFRKFSFSLCVLFCICLLCFNKRSSLQHKHTTWDFDLKSESQHWIGLLLVTTVAAKLFLILFCCFFHNSVFLVMLPRD